MIAFHSIFGMYGFWLPNDPRGSGSDYIAAWELFRYGRATKTDSRRSVAGRPYQPKWQAAARSALRWPAVELTGRQALAVVQGFDTACGEAGYRIHACAILPDHVHLVIGSHGRGIRQLVGHLKARGTRQLKQSGLWIEGERPVWGAHGWNVYLDGESDVRRAIAYVQQNPIKEGKRAQRWSLVAPFDPRMATSRRAVEAGRRKIGGAALKSQQEARRKRRG
jgi:REP element-mobilizing transposase RayT